MSDKTRASWILTTQTHLLLLQRHANGTGKSPFEHWHDHQVRRAFSFLLSGPLKGGGRGRSDQQERNYVKHNSYAGDALPNPRQYGRESLGDRDRGLAYWLEGGG